MLPEGPDDPRQDEEYAEKAEDARRVGRPGEQGRAEGQMLEELRQQAAAAHGHEEASGDEDGASLHIAIEGHGADGEGGEDARQREGEGPEPAAPWPSIAM